MGLLLFYILLALGVSFLCSVMEAVLLSITPSYVAMLEEKKDPVGPQLRALKEDVDRPLAAILSLNTIAHTVGAAGAGAQAAVVFKSMSVAVFSAILTLLILILSEIIPKTLGAIYWKPLTPSVVRLLRMMIKGLWPLVEVSKLITNMIAGGEKSKPISRAELSAIATLSQKAGVLQETESNILQNILRFRSLRAKDVMTPRPVMFALQQKMTIGEVMETHPEMRFSRIPLFEELRDDITHYVLKDELLLLAAQDQDEVVLESIKRPFTIVPAEQTLLVLFETLLQSAEHIALVVGEYGGVSGVVSMEDVVETLLGTEIVDELDSYEDMQEHARKRWRKRAKKLGLIEEEDQPVIEATDAKDPENTEKSEKAKDSEEAKEVEDTKEAEDVETKVEGS